MRDARTRLAGRADIPAIAAILAAMDTHYGTAGALGAEGNAAALVALGFPDGARFEVLLAEAKAGSGWQAAGLATLATLWPTSAARPAFFVKDLFVLDGFRGLGLGRRLMAHAAALARERDHARIDWTADAAAPAALRFHDRLGAARRPDKMLFRLDGAALGALAAEHDSGG